MGFMSYASVWLETDLSGSWLVSCYNQLPHNPDTIAAGCSYQHAFPDMMGSSYHSDKNIIKYHPTVEPRDTDIINSDEEPSRVTVFTEKSRSVL